MKILMIAPEPCFEPRGTPFSVYNRLKALGTLGHTIDLVTYHLGDTKEISNVTVYRIPKLPFINHVKIGPSLLKIPLDIILFIKAFCLLFQKKYDCVHVHEEAAVFGCLVKKIFGLTLIYDMHSSIPQQLENFNITHNRYLIGIAKRIERWIIHHSDGVIVICPQLKEEVMGIDDKKYVQIIENTPLSEDISTITSEMRIQIRNQISIPNNPIVLYTGTMEQYQGLDILIKSIPFVLKEIPDAFFILVGGETLQIELLKEFAKKTGVEKNIVFTGKRPSEEMGLFMSIADILVSPRNTGTNTPLKLYSYLKSGKPIVATNLLTHTQVLNDNVAVLTQVDAHSFAEGIIILLKDEKFAKRIGNNAKKLAESAYSYESFLEKTNIFYQYIGSFSGEN